MEVACCCAQIPAEHRFHMLAAASARGALLLTLTRSSCSGVLLPPTAAAFDHALPAVLVRATRCPRARAGVRDAAGDVARANGRHPASTRARSGRGASSSPPALGRARARAIAAAAAPACLPAPCQASQRPAHTRAYVGGACRGAGAPWRARGPGRRLSGPAEGRARAWSDSKDRLGTQRNGCAVAPMDAITGAAVPPHGGMGGGRDHGTPGQGPNRQTASWAQGFIIRPVAPNLRPPVPANRTGLTGYRSEPDKRKFKFKFPR